MAKYALGVNHARQRTFLYRSRKLIIALIVLLILIGLALYIDAFLQRQKAETPSQPSLPTSSTIAPSIQAFTTPYFQFQTNKNWNFIANESSTTKFVYRRGTPNLVSADMTVYINSSPPDVQATRVLPVTFPDQDKPLKASFVSEHCRNNLSKSIQDSVGEVAVTLQSVRFLCDVDGTNYTVIVGLENDTPSMNFARPDGTKAQYIIYFRDLRSTPDQSEFENIMNAFEIR